MAVKWSRRTAPVLWILACAQLAIGCSASVLEGDGGEGDAGEWSDAGGWSDAGDLGDAGGSTDAGDPADAGAPDAGAPTDAGTPPDAGPGADAGQPACTGQVINVGPLAVDNGRTEVGGFNRGDTVVAIIDAPPAGTVSTKTTHLTVYEYIGPLTSRRIWLSATRCDFSATSAPTYAWGTSPSLYFSVGGTDPNVLNMVPGQRYYLMIKNETRLGQPSCAAGDDCAIGITIYLPQP